MIDRDEVLGWPLYSLAAFVVAVAIYKTLLALAV